ncbi:UNVERIFIED_CONTAM: putative histone deacetylase complex subunit SAP18, partial [Eudyptes robustus]
KDCTLKELVTLIKDVNTDSRKKGTEFDFNIVFASRSSGKYQARSIGVLQNGSRGVDDAKTLQEAGFEVGDFIDVAIFPP